MDCAQGVLEPYYSAASDKRMHQLRDKGWCILKGALGPKQVAAHLEKIDSELKEMGFGVQFSDPLTTSDRKNFPGTFWTIDTCVLALKPAATAMRIDMRRALAQSLGVEPHVLASSFDGVMCSATTSIGKAGPLVAQEDGQPAEMPCLTNSDGTPAGPTHIDQSRVRDATSESHQCFCPLTKADSQDFSTILYIPTEQWTLQSVRNALKARFPNVYDAKHPDNCVLPGKRKRSDAKARLGDEGYQVPKEHCDYLKELGACRVFKPTLEPGDLLIWSSALLHCGGCVQSDKPRGPRLGVISAFAPKSVLSNTAIQNRAKWVGAGYATGQQLLNPSKHAFTVPHAARVKKEVMPEPYKRLLAWRSELKTRALYIDRPDDDADMRTYRASLRDLLGLPIHPASGVGDVFGKD